MAGVASIRIVKTIPHKGATKEWGNRYHFSDVTPTSLASWTTLVNNVVAAEKLAFTNLVAWVRAVCYADDTSPAVHVIALSGAGAQTYGSVNPAAPSNIAAWIRYATDHRDSRGHPVYLRNYYHGVYMPNGGDADTLLTAQKTALQTFATHWVTGFVDGDGVTHQRAAPAGYVATASSVDTYLSRRVMSRRG